MTDLITCNGYPATISAQYVTGGDDSFYGTQFVGEYCSMKDLNKDLPKLIAGIPSVHWRLELDFQDKEAVE